MMTGMLLGYAVGAGLTWLTIQLIQTSRRHVAWRTRRRAPDGGREIERILA
jgi:hypothetical protein